MGVASAIHNAAVQAPPSFHRVSPKPSPLKCSTIHLAPPHFPSFYHSVTRPRGGGGGQYYRIACTRGTEQDDDLAVSETGRTGSGEGNDDVGRASVSQEPSHSVDKAYTTSLKTVALCVCTAVAFGIGVGLKDGVGKASEFFAGYILEQSLSVDNLFVFVLVFKYFKVPLMFQNRVLSYGIAGAIIFRLSLILLGTATLQRFEAVNLFLAVILLYSAFKLFATEDSDDDDLSNNFIVKTCQKFIPVTCNFLPFVYLCPLISNYDGNRFITQHDGVWKVDSIPAVFGVTRDPFIVFTSNLFAILGLRSLYTLISEGMAELEYLQPSIAVVLGFIGCKMILDFFGFHVPTEASLGIVATTLITGVLLSIMKKSDKL
ncbi:hypothetical protein Tsubulata_016745 [Turnera subulata]|uniref:Thylakoid membrane protein TERC, chloroplastic n=1 Tax=Turnera subulata TaxID=218843 RepID=A0A9Q0FIP0_9ROSI|nr:hypothetical protein Tsubulata_016745 [Turnera subulata]